MPRSPKGEKRPADCRGACTLPCNDARLRRAALGVHLARRDRHEPMKALEPTHWSRIAICVKG